MATATAGAFGVTTDRGSRLMDVSRQWFSRPGDERFESLASLRNHCANLAEMSHEEEHSLYDFGAWVRRYEDREDALQLDVNGRVLNSTHYAFGQFCSRVGAPAWYIRKHAETNPEQAAAMLREDIVLAGSDRVKLYVKENGSAVLRAVTGPNYGRIQDVDLVDAVRETTGNVEGDSRWKIPGKLEGFGLTKYNPEFDGGKDSTTLYASDRDVFLFLCDDRNPVEIGKLPNGEPDLIFKGFYAWNSEVGSRTIGVGAMLLRGVCQNRCLWGVEGFQKISLRHTSGVRERWIQDVVPALQKFVEAPAAGIAARVRDARQNVLAASEEEAKAFLTKRGFTSKIAERALAQHILEEGRPARSRWDFVQGLTAIARNSVHQDARIELEEKAAALMSA